MELSDYAQALGAAQNLVPSYDQMRSNALAIQGQQLQNRAAQQEIAARDQAAAQQQQLTGALAKLGERATPENYRALAIQYPSLFKPLSEAAGAMETGQRQQLVRSTAEIRATIAAGKPEIGAQLVQRHIDADIAAGRQPDPDDQALLGMLKSGDQAQLKAASGILYATLASFGPDSAAKNVGEYGGSADEKRYVVGRALVDQGGNPLYRDPDPVQYKTVGDSLYAVGGEGGGLASGTGGGAGSGAPRSVRNNNPGNLKASSFTRSLPGFAGVDSGGFAIFDSPTSGASAQGALLGSYIDRGFNTVGKIINRWAPPSDNNDTGAYVRSVSQALGVRPDQPIGKDRIPELQSIISRVEGGPGSSSGGTGAAQVGGAKLLVQGKPKEGYRVMTPQENQANGLDPNVRYQIGPEGQITALGGQSKAGELKAWPASTLQARADNNKTLHGLDGAISLLDPKNQSKEARVARDSIGPGTGALGDYFTQWNDPEGTEARSRIGQIGGLIIKDTSGAAVSFSEDQRLAKWVPLVTDKPTVALAKLRNLRREVMQRNQAMDDAFSEDQGYRPFKSQASSSGATSGFRILRVRPK